MERLLTEGSDLCHTENGNAEETENKADEEGEFESVARPFTDGSNNKPNPFAEEHHPSKIKGFLHQ